MTKLLAITIGKAPRKDIDIVLKRNLDEHIAVKQIGVLDNLNEDEISSITTLTPADETLVTRLDDEYSIELNAKIVENHLQKIINDAEKRGYKHILLLCTGSFPDIVLKSSNLYLPDQILSSVIHSIAGQRKMGLLIPNKSQTAMMENKWREYGLIPVIASASPYSDVNEVVNSAKNLEKNKADFILMDCMGYTEEMKMAVSEKVNIPVILSSTLMVKILSEII